MAYQAEILTEDDTIRDLTVRFNRLMLAVQDIDGDKVDTAKKDIETLKNDVIYIKANYIKQYPSLSEAKLDETLEEGMVVQTLGYYSANDGGGSVYAIAKTSDNQVEDGGSIIRYNDTLHFHSISSDPVNYRQFGAVGDGVADDGLYIRRAHEYANSVGLPVHNPNGEYYFKSERYVPVRTNTNLGQTVIHIDESKTPTIQGNVYVIMSQYGQNPLSNDELTAIRNSLKKGTRYIAELAKYAGSFIKVFDSNKKVGNRQSDNPSSGWDMQDFFIIEEGGRIVGDITWDFSNVTSGLVRKLDKSFLTFEGGVFLLSGNLSAASTGDPTTGGISIQRSRTIVKNQFVGLEDGVADKATASDTGFYNLQSVYDVTLENIRVLPRKYVSVNGVALSTYGIGGSMALKCTFRNITSEGVSSHWGVFGTSLFKDVTIDNCVLNRIDIHFHAWDVNITNCKIGDKGISLTGGGRLNVENTTVYTNTLVNFRQDYGSRWDGDIRIKGCRLSVPSNVITSVLKFSPKSTDYGYTVYFGKSIVVEDLLLDYTGVTNSELAYLFDHNNQRSTGSSNVYMPARMTFKDVRVLGRSRGVRLIPTLTPIGFRSPLGNHSYGSSSESLVTNAHYKFENIDTEDIISEPQSVTDTHMYMPVSATALYGPEDLAPTIEIINCKYLHLQPKCARVKMIIRDSEVRAIDAYDNGPSMGMYSLRDCDLAPNLSSGSTDAYAYNMEGAKVNLSGCHFYPVKYAGAENVAKYGLLYFFDITSNGLQLELKSNNNGNTLHKKLMDQITSTYSKNTLEMVMKGLDSNSMDNTKLVVRNIEKHTSAPTTGTWNVGDIIMNSNPDVLSKRGWVCTTAGTPGSWQTLGEVEPVNPVYMSATLSPPDIPLEYQGINTVPFSRVETDYWKMNNTSTGKITVPYEGLYLVECGVRFAMYSQNTSDDYVYQNMEINVYSGVTDSAFPMATIAQMRDYVKYDQNQSLTGSTILNLKKGDSFAIRVYCGGKLTRLQAYTDFDQCMRYCYLRIKRIGPRAS
ncbi:putative tail fiber protein [Bacillus phage phi18]|nr:putative tail fiber protein [Bacillus phage phi18]